MNTPPTAVVLPKGISLVVFNNRWKILATLCVALLTVMIANVSLNLALPSLARSLQLTQLELTWSVEAYAMVFASLLLISSAIADRYGRKITMQIGLVLFTLASLYAGFIAQDGTGLIIARAIMGIGGALVMPTTLSIVNVIFPISERPRSIAIWSAVSGAGVMFGAIVTGVLLEFFSWKSTFIMSGVLAIIAVILNQIIVPESKDEHETPVDWLGGILATAALVGIVYAIMEAPSKGLGDSLTLVGLMSGVVALIGFVFWQIRSPNPLLDMNLFRRPAFAISSLAVTLSFFALNGATFGLTQIFQLVLGMGTFLASAAIFPMILPMIILTPTVPKIVDRFGAKWTIGSGLLIVAGGFAIMSQLPAAPSYLHILLGMSVAILGLALVMTPATNMMMAAVPSNRSGMGSAMNDTTRELGGALGVAVLGSLLSARYAHDMAHVVAKLPEQARGFAEGSLAGALTVAKQVGPMGETIVESARKAFMEGNSYAMTVSAIIAVIAAVVVIIALPHRDENTNLEETNKVQTLERPASAT